jgi:hypothetical protein
MTAGFRLTLWAGLVALMIQLHGCNFGGADAVAVLAYDQCEGLRRGLTRVTYADVAGIRGSTLLRIDEPSQDPVLLIAIFRGRQPTAGYELTLTHAQRRDDTTVVNVHWQTPKSGAVLTEKATSPCLVVALEPEGVNEVQAVDQSGQMIGELTLTDSP